MMHVCLLTPEWLPEEAGGIATYARTFATAAARRGHRVTVLASGKKGHHTEVTGSAVRVLPVGHLDAVEQARSFRDVLRDLCSGEQCPDIIEAADYGGIAALVTDPDVPPLITRLHTPLAVLLRRGEGQRIYRDDRERCRLEELQVRRSVLVTSPSAWLAREVADIWDLPSLPVVVPNPVCQSTARPARRRRQLGSPHLLYVGRLEHRKGVLVLAEAFHLWLDAGGSGHLTLVGSDTYWRSRSVRAQFEELLAPHGARIIDYLKPVERDAVLDKADLVVLPSLYENFPYTCLEAMMRHRPVLATSGSGYDEILEHDRTGFLVPPGNARELARMLSVVHDMTRLDAVGAAAARAVMRYDADRIVGELLDLYSRFLLSGGDM